MAVTTFIPRAASNLIDYGSFSNEDLVDGIYEIRPKLIVKKGASTNTQCYTVIIGKGPNHLTDPSASHPFDLIGMTSDPNENYAIITSCSASNRVGRTFKNDGVILTYYYPLRDLSDKEALIRINFNNILSSYSLNGFEYRYFVYQGLFMGAEYGNIRGSDSLSNIPYCIENKILPSLVGAHQGTHYALWTKQVQPGDWKIYVKPDISDKSTIYDFNSDLSDSVLIAGFYSNEKVSMSTIPIICVYWPEWLSYLRKDRMIPICSTKPSRGYSNFVINKTQDSWNISLDMDSTYSGSSSYSARVGECYTAMLVNEEVPTNE
jgi:hypothetical protein